MPTSYSEFTNLYVNYCVCKKSLLCNLKAYIPFALLNQIRLGNRGQKNLAKFVFGNRRQCNNKFKWNLTPVFNVSYF